MIFMILIMMIPIVTKKKDQFRMQHKNSKLIVKRRFLLIEIAIPENHDCNHNIFIFIRLPLKSQFLRHIKDKI